MARQEFIDELAALNYDVQDHGDGKVSFPYTVPVGRFAGQAIRLGFALGDDFPAAPPSGPHMSPRLLPLHPGQEIPHPLGGVHESPFGPDWEYWSRPFQDWGGTDRSVKAYMAHIRTLFETQ